MNLQKVLQNVADNRAKVCAKENYIYRLLEKCKAVAPLKKYLSYLYTYLIVVHHLTNEKINNNNTPSYRLHFLQ